MTNNKFKIGEDYCPHCRKYTRGIKNYKHKQFLCKRCGKISTLNTIETLGLNTSPKKLEKSYVNWFNQNIFNKRK